MVLLLFASRELKLEFHATLLALRNCDYADFTDPETVYEQHSWLPVRPSHALWDVRLTCPRSSLMTHQL